MTAPKYAVRATREELIAAFARWRRDPENATDDEWADSPDEEWGAACVDALVRHLKDGSAA